MLRTVGIIWSTFTCVKNWGRTAVYILYLHNKLMEGVTIKIVVYCEVRTGQI